MSTPTIGLGQAQSYTGLGHIILDIQEGKFFLDILPVLVIKKTIFPMNIKFQSQFDNQNQHICLDKKNKSDVTESFLQWHECITEMSFLNYQQ